MRAMLRKRQIIASERPGKTIQRLTILGMAVALCMLLLGGLALLDARRDAWRQAEQASMNLVIALERDVSRNLSVYEVSVQGVIEALRQPGIDQVSPGIRHAVLFDRADSAEYLGSILILDANGNVVEDSTSIAPHKLNLADRDYFRVHRDSPDQGLYFSHPFRSRLRENDAAIAISRRLSGADGRFAGVVVGSMRLAYFQKLFSGLDLGTQGSATLSNLDGTLLVRQPFQESDLGRNTSAAQIFQHFKKARSGQYTGTSILDGVERAITYRQVGNHPLLLVVAVSTDDIYAAWRRKAAVIGLILAVLCGATVMLCVMFRREMLCRMAAESALTEAAGKLAVIAATDGLTGLANRGAFEAALAQEWKRAIRGNALIAILMLDADWFKLFNDRYGHVEGDDVLRKIAGCIQRNTRRPGDVGARYGGEEFVALLPDTDLAGARTIAERICRAVGDLAIPHEASLIGHVTVSIGVAMAHPELGDVATALVQEADTALYGAKRAGRSRVSVAAGVEPPFEPLPIPQAVISHTWS